MGYLTRLDDEGDIVSGGYYETEQEAIMESEGKVNIVFEFNDCVIAIDKDVLFDDEKLEKAINAINDSLDEIRRGVDQ